MSKIRSYVITYWMEAVSWVFVIGYMGYIWYYYSWQAFIINVLFGILGYMTTYYFGDLIPIVGPLLRRPKRESGR